MARFYAYLDIRNPLVAWETAIGRLCSSDTLEKQHVFSLSVRQFSLFQSYANMGISTPRLRNEFRLERLRIERYQSSPSRLRGVFLFEDRKDAQAVVQRWDGSHFDPYFLSAIDIEPDVIARVDSEWITSNMAVENDSEWMDHYWAGDTYGVNPLTEVICSGVGHVRNTELRDDAYGRVLERSPDAVPLLSLSCIGFYLGYSHVGQTVPYLLRQNGSSRVKGVHLINMNDFENDSPLFDDLKKYKGPWPSLPQSWDGVIRLPDDSDQSFRLDLAEFSSEISSKPVESNPNQNALDRIAHAHKNRGKE